MRHATSEPHHASGDKARELLPPGVADARSVGRQLAPLGLELALVSSATRTRQTFAALELGIPAEFHDALYNSDTDTMLQRIAETDDAVGGLLVVGHSPTIPALSAQLGYASDSRAADDLQCWFPTAAFAEFTFEGSWAHLAPDALDHLLLRRVERPVPSPA